MCKLQRRPAWVDEAELNAVYARRDVLVLKTGLPYCVDHFWPLQHRDFSGLDLPWNLRVITATENGSKNNRRPDEFYSPAKFRRIITKLDQLRQAA